jgi:hypothetical protein
MTKIIFCGCENSYQDKKYGDHKRVHNEGLKGYKCTSCGGVKNK